MWSSGYHSVSVKARKPGLAISTESDHENPQNDDFHAMKVAHDMIVDTKAFTSFYSFFKSLSLLSSEWMEIATCARSGISLHF